MAAMPASAFPVNTAGVTFVRVNSEQEVREPVEDTPTDFSKQNFRKKAIGGIRQFWNKRSRRYLKEPAESESITLNSFDFRIDRPRKFPGIQIHPPKAIQTVELPAPTHNSQGTSLQRPPLLPPKPFPVAVPPPQSQSQPSSNIPASLPVPARTSKRLASTGTASSVATPSVTTKSLLSRYSTETQRRAKLKEFLKKQHQLAAEVAAKQAAGEVIPPQDDQKYKLATAVNSIVSKTTNKSSSVASIVTKESKKKREYFWWCGNDKASPFGGFSCIPTCFCLESKYCVLVC